MEKSGARVLICRGRFDQEFTGCDARCFHLTVHIRVGREKIAWGIGGLMNLSTATGEFALSGLSATLFLYLMRRLS